MKSTLTVCAVKESNLQPTIWKRSETPALGFLTVGEWPFERPSDSRKAAEPQNGSGNETTIRVSAHPVTSDRSRQ